MQGKHISEQARLFHALNEAGQAMVRIAMAELMARGWTREHAQIAALWEVYRIAEA